MPHGAERPHRGTDYSMWSTTGRHYDADRIQDAWGGDLDDSKVGPPAPNVLETELDGEVSLYNPTREEVTVLNGTASDVWYLCDGTLKTEEIVELLAKSYSVPLEKIRREVQQTIVTLRKAGLLET